MRSRIHREKPLGSEQLLILLEKECLRMNTSTSTLKQQIYTEIQSLPTDALEELSTFLEYLHFKVEQKNIPQTPYHPVKLGGMLKNVKIMDDDLTEIRKEMWGNFGNRDL
jgi:hypothetical protein